RHPFDGSSLPPVSAAQPRNVRDFAGRDGVVNKFAAPGGWQCRQAFETKGYLSGAFRISAIFLHAARSRTIIGRLLAVLNSVLTPDSRGRGKALHSVGTSRRGRRS